MKKSTMASRTHGFTLIELLVVIAIIAILAAILFPVFAKAREKARQTTCASNEKQLALGLIQYNQDYDETFPQSCTYSGPTINPTTYMYWPGLVYPYIKSAGVFSCPDDSGPNNIAASLAADNGNFFVQESYGINLGLEIYGAGDPSPHGITLAKINNPADLCMLAETWMKPVTNQGYGQFGSVDQSVGFPATWYSDTSGAIATPVITDTEPVPSAFGTPLARHTGGANIAYSDGHVKWIRFAAIYNPPTSTTTANFKLWHPDAQ